MEEKPVMDKLKIHKFQILSGILGIFILAGVVFGAYKLGQKQSQIVPRPTPTPLVICGSCPQFMPPSPDFCKDGTIIPGKNDECGCQMPPACQIVPKDWRTHTNTKYEYLIKYPDGWQPTEGNEIVEFKSEVSPARIAVAIKENPRKLSLSDWLTQHEESENWKLGSETVWVGNVQGIKWSTEPIEIETGEKYNQVDVYLTKNGLVYDLRYFIPQSVRSQLEIFNLMLSTFKFLSQVGSSQREKIFCKEPRPEVCTMECIAQPPYICGSDGKSYCNKCQACAKRGVDWYIIQTAPCGR